ncbi:MAG TPA: tRNA pseudouridine(55) synthase TruB, partial [Gemmatimonadales bacterium]|nr:tRNA pseudouridine(55) synthase TruB [Gemmatimonadales bacterium]
MDKPAAMTSHDVVQRVRRTLGTRAAGHTGTLDPFATGLLVILVGRATRLARFVEGQPKIYIATARLGIQTDTDDLTGRVVAASEPDREVPEPLVRQALAGFLGTHQQRPPQYSAKHVAGERSHRKARRGERVELADVSVTVYRIELLGYSPPDLTFRAEVSAGTYIRAIARDLGLALEVGAHLISLRREAIGSLRVEDAVTLDGLGPAAVIPARRVLGNLPTLDLDDASRQAVAHGRAVRDSGEAGKRVSGEAV